MTKWRLFYVLAMVIVIIGAAAIAGDDDKQDDKALSDYGPIDAPEEMKQVENLAGEWDVTMSWQMDPMSEEWTNTKGKAVYMSVLDGCGMHQTYTDADPKSNFQGSGLIAYNRETGKWQSVWMDNMTAAISYYEGDLKDGAMVFTGEDYWNGMKYISRITVENISNDRFDWTFDMSLDEGKTFATVGRSVYTRAK